MRLVEDPEEQERLDRSSLPPGEWQFLKVCKTFRAEKQEDGSVKILMHIDKRFANFALHVLGYLAANDSDLEPWLE